MVLLLKQPRVRQTVMLMVFIALCWYDKLFCEVDQLARYQPTRGVTHKQQVSHLIIHRSKLRS
jgi:hypothetical protein